MRRSLSRINARKAPGPDKIPGCELRECAVEVTDVFTDIFNISLSQNVSPHASKLPPSFQSRRSHLHPASMTTFQFQFQCTIYRGTIESILTSCITVWYGDCNASCRKALQRIERAAEKIIDASLPSIQDIYSTHINPPDTAVLQSAGPRLETPQFSPWWQQTEGQLHTSDWQEAQLSPDFAPLPPHAPLNSDPLTPLRSFHSPLPLHTHCDQHQSLCTGLDWPHSTTYYDSWIKDCSLIFLSL